MKEAEAFQDAGERTRRPVKGRQKTVGYYREFSENARAESDSMREPLRVFF